jgi:hypothetical protein
LESVVKSVAQALQRNDAGAAAQLLVAAEEAGTLPSQPDLLPALRASVDKPALRGLLDALSRFPCFYCTGGFVRCDTCGGRGLVGRDAVCDECAGLGITSCDFCTGSGWISIKAIPRSLRLLVLVRRIKLALHHSERLLDRPLPTITPDALPAGRKAIVQLLVSLERQRAVLENALNAVEQALREPGCPTPTRPMILSAAAAVPRLDRRLEDCLRQLGRLSRLAVEQAGADASKRAAAALRAEYYESLCEATGFAGSSLGRPRLWRLAQSLPEAKQTPAPPTTTRPADRPEREDHA